MYTFILFYRITWSVNKALNRKKHTVYISFLILSFWFEDNVVTCVNMNTTYVCMMVILLLVKLTDCKLNYGSLICNRL